MKYLLKQNKEDKGVLCDKVTIDGFEYYVDYSQPIEVGKWYISNQAPRLCVKIKEGKYPYIHLNNKGEEIADFYTWKGVIICSNNPNIDIPQVVDKLENIVKAYVQELIDCKSVKEHERTWISSICHQSITKSQEIYPFSLDDVKEIINLAREQYWDVDNRGFSSNTEGDWSFKYSTEDEIIQKYQETKVLTIFYE